MTPLIDARRARRGFARAAAGYEAVAVLQREIASRMQERLDYVKIQPGRVIDLGCGTASRLQALAERYPQAEVLGIDASEAMLRAGNKHLPLLAADAEALPLKPGVAGLVWSNLLLHWLGDPLAGLREASRILETGGLLMFSSFGPDTLKELRASFSDGYEHCLPFIDMHDYGDMLIDCGFAEPVMEVERLTMTYPTAEALLGELRQNGSICASPGRRKTLLGKERWRDVRKAYEAFRVDGRLPASFEVIYGHAWKAAPRNTADGRAVIRFAA